MFTWVQLELTNDSLKKNGLRQYGGSHQMSCPLTVQAKPFLWGSAPRSLALALQSYGLASSLISAQTENKSLKCKVEVWLSSDLPGKNALLRSMLRTLGWLQEYQNWSSPLLPVPVETHSLRWATWAVSLPSSCISWTWLMFMRPLTTIDVFVFKVPYDWLPLTKYASWSMIFCTQGPTSLGKSKVIDYPWGLRVGVGKNLIKCNKIYIYKAYLRLWSHYFFFEWKARSDLIQIWFIPEQSSHTSPFVPDSPWYCCRTIWSYSWSDPSLPFLKMGWVVHSLVEKML